jgi:C_GCAxxG_C_C family probable redox protein
MKNKAELVDNLFPVKMNCAQTIFSLHAEELGLDEETTQKIASGFAGGMACANTCGAVTGSYMVIGMKHGHASSDPEDKVATKTRILEFNKHFEAEHGTLMCKELVGYDIATAEGMEAAREKGVFANKCPQFLKTACNILAKEF